MCPLTLVCARKYAISVGMGGSGCENRYKPGFRDARRLLSRGRLRPPARRPRGHGALDAPAQGPPAAPRCVSRASAALPDGGGVSPAWGEEAAPRAKAVYTDGDAARRRAAIFAVVSTGQKIIQ